MNMRKLSVSVKMTARYKSLLILFCLFLLSACAPDTDTDEQVFYRDMQAPLNGVASSDGERSYIQTLGIDYQTMTYNLYCWKNGEVSPVSNGEYSSLPFGRFLSGGKSVCLSV